MPHLDTIRTQYQVPDDEIIMYRPRAFGTVDVPFTESYAQSITKTEGALLDQLTRDRGLLGLRDFQGQMRDAFAQGEARYPNNPLPSGIPADLESAWQGNDGHRDAFYALATAAESKDAAAMAAAMKEAAASPAGSEVTKFATEAADAREAAELEAQRLAVEAAPQKEYAEPVYGRG